MGLPPHVEAAIDSARAAVREIVEAQLTEAGITRTLDEIRALLGICLSGVESLIADGETDTLMPTDELADLLGVFSIVLDLTGA